MTLDTNPRPHQGRHAPIKAERMPFGRWIRSSAGATSSPSSFCVWALFPVFYVITLAFSGGNTLTAACPPERDRARGPDLLLPATFSTANFETLLTSDQWPFLIWFGNTLLIATVNSFAALFMGAAAAFAFSRLRFRGRRTGLLDADAGPDVPGRAGHHRDLRPAAPRSATCSRRSGIGSVWGLLLVYLGTRSGVNTFLMKGYFDTIPVDIDESARIDGAATTRIFFGLVMRLSMPILIVVFFVTFQSTFNELPIAQVVLPDAQNTTLAVGLNGLVSNPLVQQWGLMAAGGLMAAIPLFIVFLITQRSLVTGLTSGAVKG